MALITTLDSSVTDETLMPMGAMKFKATKKDGSSGGFFYLTGPFTAKIVGDGYFTDSTRTANKGTELTATSGTTYVYTSNGDYVVIITSKYGLTAFYPISLGILSFDVGQLDYSIKLTELAGDTNCYGNVPDLKTMPLLTSLSLKVANVEGELALDSSSKLTKIYLDGSAVVGTLENIAFCIGLQILSARGCSGISGDVSALTGLSSLREIALTDSSVSGSVTDLGKFVNATAILVHGSSVTGTCAELLAALTANGKTSGSVQVWTNEMTSSVTYKFPLS